MNTFFKMLFKLFDVSRVASGKVTIVGSLSKPVYIQTGFHPKDISISLGHHHGHPNCAHDEDWFSWNPTDDGFVLRAKLVSEHREVFWTASR